MADSTRIRMGVRAVSVVTVSLDDTLSISGKAADAKAVGDALAEKTDISTLMSNVRITVDGQESDAQGVVLLYGEDIPVDDSNDAPTVAEKLAEIDGKTANDINYAIGQTIKDKIDDLAGDVGTISGTLYGSDIPVNHSDATSVEAAIQNAVSLQYGSKIPMSESDTTKVAAAIAAVDGKTASDIVYASGSTDKISDVVGSIGTRLTAVEGNYLSKAQQTLQPGEQAAVQQNLGLGDASTKDVRNDLTAETVGYVLDARQGTELKALIDQLTAKANLQPVTTVRDLVNEGVAIPAGDSNTTISIAVPVVQGYIPVGIVGQRVSGTNSSWCNIARCVLGEVEETGEAAVTAALRNTGANAASNVVVHVDVLYARK